MNTAELYERVGGRVSAARLCKATIWATYKWDENGIPSKHWLKFARKTGLNLDEVSKVKPLQGAKNGNARAAR